MAQNSARRLLTQITASKRIDAKSVAGDFSSCIKKDEARSLLEAGLDWRCKDD